MSGYVDNRCSQATVSEVEALIRERDEALAKLAALVEAALAVEEAQIGVLEEAESEARDEAVAALRGLRTALRASRGEP